MNIKSNFKKGITKVYADNECETIDKIHDESIKVISFDVFDTLVHRNVSKPEKIFELLKLAYNEKYSCDDDLDQIRINAEIQARKKNGKKEITLEDIYKYFPDLYKSKIKGLEKENNRLHRIIDKFHDTIDKFIHWICKKFDMGAEDNLVREFERENHILIDAEKQVKREDREKEWELER